MIKRKVILLLLFAPTIIHCMEKDRDIQNGDVWLKPQALKKIEPQDPPSKTEIILNRVGNYLCCRDFIALGMHNRDFNKAHQKYTFYTIDTYSHKQGTSASLLVAGNKLSHVVTKDCFNFSLPSTSLHTSATTSLRHAIASYKNINEAIRITYSNRKDPEGNLEENKQLAQECEAMIHSSYVMLIHKLITDPIIDINEKDENGNTFLHDAITLLLPRPTGKLLQEFRKKTNPTYLNMITKITQHPKIAINAVNNKGRTALDYAWKDAVVKLLKRQGGSYSQFAAYSQSIVRHKKIIVLCLFSGIFTLIYVFYRSLPKIIEAYAHHIQTPCLCRHHP